MYDYQPLPCAPNSNSIAQAVDDAVDLLESTETLCVFYCLMLQSISVYGGYRFNTEISVSQDVSCDICSTFIAQLRNET